MATRTSEYEKLNKRLGELDKERRAVLTALRKNPQFILKMVTEKLKAFTTEGRWFMRKNAPGQEAYFTLVGFVIEEKSINQSDRGSVLMKVTLTWDFFDYNTVEKKKYTEAITISAFNELEAQVLNGRVPAPKFSEKIIKKNVLTAQKKELEEKLKKIKLEIAAV